MSQGISNFEINKFFENETNQDLKNNYMGYINFYEIIKKRNAKYSFAIFNTDKHNKPGMHFWSFMDIHPKRNLLLLGLDGFKFFIADNDEAIIDELLYNFKKCKVSLVNQKLTLCTIKFSTDSWKKLLHTRKRSADRYCSKLFLFVK